MTTKDPTTRRAAIAMLRAGSATMAEIAQLANTSRQTVRYWAEAEALDPIATRWDRLKREWARRTSKPRL